MASIDFEAEGLLGDLQGEARTSRLRLLEELAEDGVPLEELRRAVEEERLVLLPVERVFEHHGKRLTSGEVAERAGIDLDFLERLLGALGVSIPERGQRVLTEADVGAAQRAKVALDAGVPAEGILETARITGMAMAQLAAANTNLIGESFIRAGDNERDLALRWAAVADDLAPRFAETLAHVHGLHLRESIRQAMVSDSNLSEGRLGEADEMAVAFADMVDFTRLGERLEIEAVGEVTGRFGEMASVAASPPVRLVKLIGDAAMFVSPEPGPLIDAVLGLVEEARATEVPSLRAGVAIGPALGRGGDWYGPPVNLASRITGFARPDSVVVAEAVKDALEEAGDDSLRFSFAGRRRFKGIKGEVPVHRVRRASEPD